MKASDPMELSQVSRNNYACTNYTKIDEMVPIVVTPENRLITQNGTNPFSTVNGSRDNEGRDGPHLKKRSVIYLSETQRIHKRRYDREAQRQKRQRTKEYIGALETKVKQLEEEKRLRNTSTEQVTVKNRELEADARKLRARVNEQQGFVATTDYNAALLYTALDIHAESTPQTQTCLLSTMPTGHINEGLKKLRHLPTPYGFLNWKCAIPLERQTPHENARTVHYSLPYSPNTSRLPVTFLEYMMER